MHLYNSKPCNLKFAGDMFRRYPVDVEISSILTIFEGILYKSLARYTHLQTMSPDLIMQISESVHCRSPERYPRTIPRFHQFLHALSRFQETLISRCLTVGSGHWIKVKVCIEILGEPLRGALYVCHMNGVLAHSTNSVLWNMRTTLVRTSVPWSATISAY